MVTLKRTICFVSGLAIFDVAEQLIFKNPYNLKFQKKN